jgi:deazaflavin-dependent oxidoreductase (nitroreductase family)
MNTSATDFVAGKPRRSGPIRAVSRRFGAIAKPISGTRLLPLWAIVRHRGRTSGTAYATPVVALHTDDGFIIPLPFGDATQWARNLFAAGGGSIRSGGREHKVIEPQILELAAALPYLPLAVRFATRRLGIRHWVLVRRGAP